MATTKSIQSITDNLNRNVVYLLVFIDISAFRSYCQDRIGPKMNFSCSWSLPPIIDDCH
jgi:hypothetical protein